MILALILCLYFYFRIFLASFKSLIYFLPLFFLLTGLIESLLGLAQLYGWEVSHHSLFRITGTFFNPGPYSGYLAMVFPMALYYTLSGKKILRLGRDKRSLLFILRWIIAAATLAFSLLILPASMSRAAWIASLTGSFLVIYGYFRKNKNHKRFIQAYKKRFIPVLFCFSILLIAGLTGMYHLKKDSADGRSLIWKVSLPVISQYPQGVGLGRFPGVYGEAQAAYFENGRGSEQDKNVAGNPEYAFNEYLQICVEQGIIPFVLFLSVMCLSVYTGIRKKKFATTGSLLALLVFASASYPFSVLPFLIGLVLLIALIANPAIDYKTEKYYRKTVFLLLLICIFVTGYVVRAIYPGYDAYKSWNQSKTLYHAGMYEDATKEYASVYPQLSDRTPFLFEYAQSLSKSGLYEASNRILQKAVRISCDPMLYNIMGKNYQAMKQYSLAEECFFQSAHMVPNRMYPYYLLALMYHEAGRLEEFREMSRIVLTKEPKVHSTAVEEMRKKINKMFSTP
jgi:tetratricopeptide (TPR) repeat protein